ncbi:MAG: aminomethyl-transferring glycine dehydrogenase subunit GcvPA [Dethiobacteria bacterium]|nr:aminomethyl-transferring glycine dehydrogenase subunit GcvPA [Dethiobacteria bacterium]
MGGKHYLPLTDEDRREMLAAIGVKSVEDLFSDIPAEVRLKGDLNLPPALAESEVLTHLTELASKNKHFHNCVSFMGAGVYDHFIPSVIKHVTGRSEFYTSYTPYQPEVSQGVLQAIFEYQTMICQLTGMDVANASMYDGGTAVAEGAIMGCGATRRSKALVSRSVSPFYREVLRNYFNSRGLSLEEIPIIDGCTDRGSLAKMLGDDIATVVLQQPNFFGMVENMSGIADMVHEHKAVLVVSVDPLSLPLLQTPAEYGADIVVGEGQGLGVPASFGGPLLGIMAARDKFVRQVPGRIAGETVDSEGNRGFVLTLQTREQHIRREKAASNICSNEALVALGASVYLAAMGPQGMREVAEQCLQKAAYAREKITALSGYGLAFPGINFKEFALTVPGDPAELNKKLLEKNILGGIDLAPFYPELKNTMLFAVTEKRTREEIDALVRVLEGWK